MIELLQPSHLHSAMRAVAGATAAAPRTAWFEWWRPRQAGPCLFDASISGATARWQSEDCAVRDSFALFAKRCGMGAFRALPSDVANDASALLGSAMSMLRTWNAHVGAAVETLVHTVLLAAAPSSGYGGASLSDMPGVIWIRPDPTWRADQMAECLLHETVHQAVFLFDLALGLLADAAYDNEIRVPSAVRAIYPSQQEPMRAIWAAYHAVLVACAPIPFLRRVERHQEAAAFERALEMAVPWLLEPGAPVSEIGRAVLATATEGTCDGLRVRVKAPELRGVGGSRRRP
jgi:hypothetical protein